MSASVEMATIECAHCHGSVDESAALRLFDGRWYCRACVERESPALAEYAATHNYLDDQITYDVKALGFAAVLYCFVAAIGMVVLLEFTPPEPGMNPHVVIPIGSIILAPIGFLLQWMVAQVQLPRTILADDGFLNVFTQMQAKQYPLRDCEWRVERSGLRLMHDGVSPRKTFLALYVPGWRRQQLLPACLDDGSRELWVHFLRLAGVPEHH